MASKKRKANTVVDNNDISKKSKEELKAELKVIGLNAPATFSRKQLLDLLNENSNRNSVPAINQPSSDHTDSVPNIGLETSNSTLRELSVAVKSLSETVKSQGEILKTVVDFQKKAEMGNTACSNVIAAPAMESTQGTTDFVNSTMKVSAGMYPHIQSVSHNQRQNIKEKASTLI